MTVSPKLSTLSIHEYTVRGYELEKSCKSSAALSVWTEALVHYPDNTVFALRKAVMSLTENRTDAALTALDIAENSLEADLYREQIMDLRRQTRAFMASQHNVAAMDAYNDGLFSLARDEFTALLELSPEHPYALAYLVHCAAFAPDFEYQLRTQLSAVDQRILITGCGRSGTWLLAAMMAGMTGVTMAPRECHYGQFIFMDNVPGTHIVKRQHDTYTVYDRIPESIKIINIVRHPFDVMSSTHLGVEQYVPLERYEAELSETLRVLVGRPNTLTVRYEDLVAVPEQVEARIVAFTGLDAAVPFPDFHNHASMPSDIVEAMHGLRPLDRSRVYAWQGRTDQHPRYRELIENSDGTLKLVASFYGYDLDVAV